MSMDERTTPEFLRGPAHQPPLSKRHVVAWSLAALTSGLLAVELLETTPFWAAAFLVLAGFLLATARAFWVSSVLAGLYTVHYSLIQDLFGDEGPFVWRNWMVFGLGITALLGGFALHAMATGTFRSLPRINWVYICVIALTIGLSALTFGPRSFQSQDSPWQYNREWMLTLLTAAFISVLVRLRLRPFLWTLLALGIIALLQLPWYLGTGLGTNTASSMVLAVFSAALLFENRWIAIVVSAPLVAGTLVLMKEGSVVGLLLGGLVLLVLQTRGTRQRWVPYAISIGSALLAVFAWISLGSARLEDQILHRGMDVRLEVYGQFMQMWRDSPMTGIWQISPSVPRPAQMYAGVPGPIYAHNPVLEVLGSWGLIGLALWGTLQAIAAVTAYSTPLLPMWVAAISFAMSSGDLSGNPRYWVVGAVAVALAATAASQQTNVNEADPTEVTR